jgi:uncharacterized membrane protein
VSVPDAIRFKPETEASPVEEAVAYVSHQWVQVLTPIRTRCYRCHEDSPIVHVPEGAMAFGNPRLLRRGQNNQHKQNYRDITRDTITAFGNIGWRFQLRRSYCPKCKGLGSV